MLRRRFLKSFLSGYLFATNLFLIGLVLAAVYLVGFIHGSVSGYNVAESGFVNALRSILENEIKEPEEVVVHQQAPLKKETNLINANWGGPELWTAVNNRRRDFGVNQLNKNDSLCTIASIRLNELLELGKLDGHEGFTNMTERRPDLKPIFDSFSTVSEFLVSGATSPTDAVSLWENTLGHKKLLTGGEYVWGCIYAQNGFGVAITGY